MQTVIFSTTGLTMREVQLLIKNIINDIIKIFNPHKPMREKLLETPVRHNEKWPRQDIMSIPTFELQEGDKIIFQFLAHTGDNIWGIQIEDADKMVKGDVIDRPLKIAEFSIVGSAFYRIPETGTYNFPIPNPMTGSEEQGILKIFKEPSTENESTE
ncbi:MAG TPA: hypothetical protein VK112_01475 [Fodinibius sp.]|nr:hypothetical protein [Fodinibius sp.]